MRLRVFSYCACVTAIGTAVVAGMLRQHDNNLNKNRFNRLNNMEYVKHNNPAKYINALEIVNKSNASRISPEYLDNIWEMKAKEVKDSIDLSKNKDKRG